MDTEKKSEDTQTPKETKAETPAKNSQTGEGVNDTGGGSTTGDPKSPGSYSVKFQ